MDTAFSSTVIQEILDACEELAKHQRKLSGEEPPDPSQDELARICSTLCKFEIIEKFNKIYRCSHRLISDNIRVQFHWRNVNKHYKQNCEVLTLTNPNRDEYERMVDDCKIYLCMLHAFLEKEERLKVMISDLKQYTKDDLDYIDNDKVNDFVTQFNFKPFKELMMEIKKHAEDCRKVKARLIQLGHFLD